MKPLLGQYTDTAITLLCLVAVFCGVAAFDRYDTPRVRSELEAVSSGEGRAPGETIVDARLRVFEGSIRRWTWVVLPALILLAGLAVGLGCTTWRWAWLMVFVGLLPALAMAVAFHIDAVPVGVAWAAGYLAGGAGLATAIAWLRARRAAAHGVMAQANKAEPA